MRHAPASRLAPYPGLLLAALLCMAGQARSEQPAHVPTGRWITASGNLEVEVAPCGNALCGTVTRVLANRSMSRPGQAMTAQDGRPALGLQILSDFRLDEDQSPPRWQGRIYNRENGKTYHCLMSMGEGGTLQLRGYVGLPLFGSTQTWTRP